jgi:hypothetical protein
MRDTAPGGVAGLVDAAVQGARCLRATRDGGRMVSLRACDGPGERGIVNEYIRVTDHLEEGETLRELAAIAERGHLRLPPVVGFGPADAADAHRQLILGGAKARPVITFAVG